MPVNDRQVVPVLTIGTLTDCRRISRLDAKGQGRDRVLTRTASGPTSAFGAFASSLSAIHGARLRE
jgi:hypothetical protein